MINAEELALGDLTLDEQDAYREMLERKTAARLERLQWARWIVRQGRNPEPGCPQCGPLGMDAAPRTCIPHQALARLAGAEE